MTYLHSQRDDASILVIGATGKTGKRVAQKLRARGRSVRHGSRQSTPAFDWQDSATWAAALAGISAAYVSYFPDLAVPEAPSAIGHFCQVAKAAGVQHLVLLSGRGEPAAQHCEQIVKRSGMQWTIIRASWFNQNFSEGEFAGMVQEGTIALPATTTPEPFVDAEDIADVAVAALTGQCAINRLYEVTGPRAITFAEAAAELGRAQGRVIHFVPVAPSLFEQGLRDQQVPLPTIDLLNFLFTEVLDGRNAHTCNGVFEALGRPPRDFRDFANELAATQKENAS